MRGYNGGYTTCLLDGTTESKSGIDYEPQLNSSHNENCFKLGYNNGLDSPFDQNHYDECGTAYYDGFISGCMTVGGNSVEVCEKFTDSKIITAL